jgi:hypothetical protein
MALLNSKFDILRGYPNGSALCWSFAIKKSGGSYVSVPAGTIVTTELSGTSTVVDKATTPNTSIADPKTMWLVVEGNDDFSGAYVQKCAAAKLGSGIIWETDNYATGAYTPGTPVSVSSGQIKVKASNEQIIGYVLEDRTATKGTVVVEA